MSEAPDISRVDRRHVFLIGFMGSGKSTVGRMLADELRLSFVDLDLCVEEQDGRRVADIFAEDGEAAFRAVEHEALAALADQPPSVVACGGGVVLMPENRTLLSGLGCIVYLEVTAGEALARIGDVTGRPLLASGGPAAASTILSAREGLYHAAADVVVDTTGKSAEQVTTETAARLRAGGCVQ